MPQPLTDYIGGSSLLQGSLIDPVSGQPGGRVTSASIVIAAAKSGWDSEDNYDISESFYPIGMVQSAVIMQSRANSMFKQIGDPHMFMLPSTFVQVSASISKMYIDGPSLLAALYPGVETETNNDAGFTTTFDLMGDPQYFLINLASEAFSNHLDLAFFFFTEEALFLGGICLTDCLINNHQFSLAAQQSLLVESVNLMASGIKVFSTS